MTLPVLYTPEEVAEKLKATRRTVYRWLLSGRLVGKRAGDGWRITEADLMDFLESRKAPAPHVGSNHPDYERWLRYFTYRGIASLDAAPSKRGKKAKRSGLKVMRPAPERKP
jgi:excisionase family DNA binding protein